MLSLSLLKQNNKKCELKFKKNFPRFNGGSYVVAFVGYPSLIITNNDNIKDERGGG